jgi:transcriptional regulator with XRE-family HTH domain
MAQFETVYARIERLLRARNAERKKLGLSKLNMNQLSLLGGSRGMLAQLKSRTVHETEQATLKAQQAAPIAAELGVTVEYLLGTESGKALSDERYPSRNAAIEAARALKIDERAIEKALLHEPETGSDPGTRYWFRLIESFELALSSRPASSR